MQNQDHFYQQLVKRYAANEATAEELEVFLHLLQQGRLDAALETHMNQQAFLHNAPAYTEEAPVVAISPTRTRRVGLYRMAAAAVIVLLAGGTWWWVARNAGPEATGTLALQKDIPAGVSRATLTLDDGSVMQLDTITQPKSVHQGQTTLVTAKGTLTYREAQKGGSLRYNTLTTHKGEQYRVTLSDGTVVLADAATTLRFPVAFTGSERVVEVNGHAWFEVAANARQPFIVKKGNQTVQVLGTSFDIHAYDNERATTITLLQGKVRVNNGNATCLLAPGQQAVTDNSSQAGITLIKDADVEQATAWINGKMLFRNAAIGTIMRAAERWYNIEVIIPESLANRHFYFAVNRAAPLSELLHFLEVYRIKYKLDTVTRKLTLM